MLLESLFVFLIIFLAEIGDKSQLVCMTLSAKHKAKHVLFGAILAFGILNLIAVQVGAAISGFIPEYYLNIVVAILFAGFGLHSLFSKEDDEEEDCSEVKSTKHIVFTSFSLIFLAELGDKTQLAVATMSGTQSAVSVWIASTLALTATSALGVFLGSRFLTKIKPSLLHKISGVFFLVMAAIFAVRVI
jgi:putative Ca2+/H+ antiporter (TMEM165/GDT1 family)